MIFESIETLKEIGFEGFETIQSLWETKCANIPEVGGVYIVFRTSIEPPFFLEETRAGLYKGEDLTVSISKLRENWIDNASVLYIGKAGGPNIAQGLKKRLQKYVGTGYSKNARRKGGKLIWQIEDAPNFLLCWMRVTGTKTPKDIEDELKALFKHYYGKLPFANLV